MAYLARAVQGGESHERPSLDARPPEPARPFWCRPSIAAWSGLIATAAIVTAALVSVAAGVLAAVVLLGGLVARTDVTVRRIPNALVVATGVAGLGISVVSDREAIVLGVGLFVGTAMLIVHLVDPDGLGFGDVKYATALAALLTTTLSPGAVVGVVMVASLGAAVAPVLIRVWRPAQRGVPYGALLSVAAILAVIAEVAS